MGHARRRMGRDQPELYVGHHRQPQGRRLPPPRGLSARPGQRADRLHAEARGLSVDAADVPLQRLVLPLDDIGRCRHACVSPPGAPEAHLGRAGRPPRHTSLRRAHRHVDDPRDPRRRQARARSCGGILHRRRPAARGRAGGHGRERLQRHPPLRPDRDLRPGGGQRLEGGVGRPRRSGPRHEEGAPGRALRRARGAVGDAIRTR